MLLLSNNSLKNKTPCLLHQRSKKKYYRRERKKKLYIDRSIYEVIVVDK